MEQDHDDGGGHTPRERPRALPGSTQRISTGWGKVYVNINVDGDGEPFEAFVMAGRSGGLYNAHAEALGKLVSSALRSGCDPARIADDLTGIRSGKAGHDNGDTVHSIPDAVGLALRRHLEGRHGEGVREGGGADAR
jgi:ribonucleoside-diphosphate reductase alpha chain